MTNKFKIKILISKYNKFNKIIGKLSNILNKFNNYVKFRDVIVYYKKIWDCWRIDIKKFKNVGKDKKKIIRNYCLGIRFWRIKLRRLELMGIFQNSLGACLNRLKWMLDRNKNKSIIWFENK
jgi:hypothetical protein